MNSNIDRTVADLLQQARIAQGAPAPEPLRPTTEAFLARLVAATARANCTMRGAPALADERARIADVLDALEAFVADERQRLTRTDE